MINGRSVTQITKVARRSEGASHSIIIEVKHRVVAFKAYLPAGPLAGGHIRKHDLIQFYADPGGLRTINADDIIL
jgi:hypothetical protein